jgi:hypothetical protein
MEILRIPSKPVESVFRVSLPSTEYSYRIVDDVDHSVVEGFVTSEENSEVTISFPSEYDNDYTLYIDDTDYFVTVARPYVDPYSKASTASEVAEYTKSEELARAIIDSIVSDGFYYKKRFIETVGIGAGYIPVWKRVNRVLKLYENNVLMFDATNPEDYPVEYGLTGDKSAIVEVYGTRINRLEGAQLIFPEGSSDFLDTKYIYRGFPRSFDYKILVSYGYRAIPSDIVKATEILANDILCGKMEYFLRSVTDYKTDQYQIRFDKGMLSGTGNIVVDKILSKYTNDIKTPGVL